MEKYVNHLEKFIESHMEGTQKYGDLGLKSLRLTAKGDFEVQFRRPKSPDRRSITSAINGRLGGRPRKAQKT